MARQARPVSGDRHAGEGVVPRGGQALALATLCTLLFLTFLDNTVACARGRADSLHAGVTDLQWVVGAYALTFASLMLACGMIGDELGRKKVMLTGAGVFCAGSVLCALAPNVQTLIAGRAVMGLGAGQRAGHAVDAPPPVPRCQGQEPGDRRVAATSGFALAAGRSSAACSSGLELARHLLVQPGVRAGRPDRRGRHPPESADPRGRPLLGAGTLAALVFAIIDAESAGFGSADVIILLCASAVLLAAFVWRERRAPNPLLDLRYLRVPQFTTANIAAFCTYFSTFAIFFFTALYLVEVVGASGYRLAAVFLPMTVLMILASVLAGRWTVRAGPRWSITIGCLLLACGLFLTDGYLSPHPDYGPLMVALALAGVGIGTTVVPITSSVLSAVPPERSGMAASATNTSREIGAVTGVAVLGSLVISQLRSSLTTELNHLGIPAQFQALVINAIETGQIPQNTSAHAGYGKIVQDVIDAAYTAFHNGLHAALYLSAGLALAAGLLAFITLPSRPANAEPLTFPLSQNDRETEQP